MTIRKIKASLVKSDVDAYVGEYSYLFYDIDSGSLRIYDGTPGGTPILGGGGGGATQLNELSDVNTSTPTNRNVLIADGIDFESRALVEADISDLGAYLTNVIEDTTPVLGGNLDVGGFKITSAASGNIDIEPNGTGNVLLGNFEFDADQVIGVGQDNYVLTYNNGTGTISLEAVPTSGDVFKVGTPVDNQVAVWTGDGTIEGNSSFTWDSATSTLQVDGGSGSIIAGNPGTEGTGITVNGATYESVLKVSDIGGSNAAQFIMHRHSTTLPALIIGARAKDNTAGHTIVDDNDVILTMLAAGWDGVDYALSSEIRFEVDGTPGVNDMPGQITFMTAADGTHVPLERMRIRATGNVEIDNNLDIDGYLFQQEQAAADTDKTGYGQWWVRNDTPNTPMFTDDTGTDYVLNASAGTVLWGTITGTLSDQTDLQAALDAAKEEEMFAQQVDFVTNALIYRGEAAPGTATSAAAWRIRKLDINNASMGDVATTWADGNDNFDNVWDDRATLSYS